MKLSARLENVRKVIHAINLVCDVDGKELEESGVDLIEHQVCNKQCKILGTKPNGLNTTKRVLGPDEYSCANCILLDATNQAVDRDFDNIIQQIKVYELLE